MRVWYTRLLFWADGFTVAPSLILIHPKFKDDPALLVHEMTHAEQMRRLGWLRFWWCYAISPAFRQEVEVAAYRAQLMLRPNSLEAFAAFLARDYDLTLTVDQARALLQQEKNS